MISFPSRGVSSRKHSRLFNYVFCVFLCLILGESTMRFICLLLTPLFCFGTIRSDLNVGLRALQQIRTLIPERLSDDEFSIIIDQKAFAQELKKNSHPMRAEGIPSAKSIG